MKKAAKAPVLWVTEAMRYFPAVYRIAYLQTLTVRAARLAAQQAFLCFAARKGEGDTLAEKERLIRLTLFCGREQCLREKFRSEDPLTQELLLSSPEDEAAFLAVKKLSKTKRIILYLYYCEDYTAAETAAVLRRGKGFVSRSLRRAQAAQKAELGEQDWKTLLPKVFAAIQPEEFVQAELSAQLAQGKQRRSPVVSGAAFGVACGRGVHYRPAVGKQTRTGSGEFGGSVTGGKPQKRRH